jgi:hypothetical protein
MGHRRLRAKPRTVPRRLAPQEGIAAVLLGRSWRTHPRRHGCRLANATDLRNSIS